jgi:hypothetical protein
MRPNGDNDTIRIGPRLEPEEERRLLVEYYAARQPVQLAPITTEEEFPDEFRDVLELQILEYREDDGILAGETMRVLRPVWTLVPKDEDTQLSLDLRFAGQKSA